MTPAVFEWDDETSSTLLLTESTSLKPKQYSTIDHSYYELKTKSISHTDSRMKVGIFWSFLLASLRAFALSVLVT
jgi:hypothetical protein